MDHTKDFWKLKLMAFLHDPPCKCFDIGRHEKIAKSARSVAGITEDDYSAFVKHADWAASAADRFPFPARKCSSQFTGDSEYPFKHPMGGSSLSFANPIETAELAEEKFQVSIGGIPSEMESWKDKFFLYWRRWPEESAKQDERLAYLPADTRIPDHTIWTHMSLTSAFQGCVKAGERVPSPAFLIFQLGPVQDFIASAKSTRDLWSGSYILSWLTANAIKAITDEVGPDSVIFPSLRGQPIYDLLHKKEIYDNIKYNDDTLWNRMYKKDKDGSSAINEGLRRLVTPTIPNRFCALVPEWKAEELAKKAEDAIHKELKRIGDKIWEYLEGEGDVSTDIDRQRWNKQLALFPQITWQVAPWTKDVKELLEKKENSGLKVLEELALKTIPQEDRDERNYQDGKLNDGFYWSAQFNRITSLMAGRRNLRDFEQFITDEHQIGSEKDMLTGKEEEIGNTGKSAITHIKREFALRYLYSLLDCTKAQFENVIGFESTEEISNGNKQSNNKYIAVIALDGDKMGQWLSGENAPKLIEQLAGKAVDYFDSLDKFDKNIKRVISPAYHLQFSEALSNFSLYIADKVVRAFDGQLIYAGGDDVLAMLPASKALACAEVLRACFRGKNIPKELANKLELAVIHDGFVSIDKGYPLLMPGVNADVSCGIAVGHDSYPLQALVREAQIAEKRAKKKYEREAFAISLIKRSGEIIQWGAKWDESALPLYKQFTTLSDEEILSGRFPYALAEFLKPYKLDAKDSTGKSTVDSDFKEVILKEFEHVVAQKCKKNLSEDQKRKINRMNDVARTYLDYLFKNDLPEDFVNLFLTSTFMNRQRGE